MQPRGRRRWLLTVRASMRSGTMAGTIGRYDVSCVQDSLADPSTHLHPGRPAAVPSLTALNHRRGDLASIEDGWADRQHAVMQPSSRRSWPRNSWLVRVRMILRARLSVR